MHNRAYVPADRLSAPRAAFEDTLGDLLVACASPTLMRDPPGAETIDTATLDALNSLPSITDALR